MTTEIASEIAPHHNQQQHKRDVAPASLNSTTTDNNNNNTSVSSANLNSTAGSALSRSEQQIEALLNDPNFKFPLENSWSFWFYKNEKTKAWKDNVKFITAVDFVEDFWGVYNHLQLVSKVGIGCDYMFFKNGIPPMWEDPQNLDGGRWVLNLDKKFHHSSLDIYWLNTLLALIGEQFDEDSDLVNGVWVNVRPRGDKIALWTKAARNVDAQMRIGRKFKDILALRDQTLTYEIHEETDKKQDPAPLYTL